MNIRRMLAIVAVVGILATTSFAAPLCALCAPPSAQRPVVQASRAGHDHCGSPAAGSPESPSVTVANCEHGGAGCVTAAEPERPAAQPAASAADFAGSPRAVAIVVPPGSDAPPLGPALTSHSASIPLTLVLRV